VNRTRVWLVVSPVLAGGVLLAHSLAYRLTGIPTDPFHSYLEHVPQILLLSTLAGLALGGLGPRLQAPPVATFPVVALTTFAAQEHLERLVHGAGVPFLLTTPAFLVGLVLQIPFALVAWALARWLVAAVRALTMRTPTRPRLVLYVFSFLRCDPFASSELRLPPGRGPPALLPSV
jgi:ABC-type amino acid transport system permease subunit